MKRRWSVLLAAAILLCNIQEMRGQSSTRMGIAGGPTVADAELDYSSWLNSFNFPYTVNQSTRKGLAVGGMVEFPLSEPLSLMVEPMYIQKGITMDLSSSGVHELTAIFRLDYLQIPVTVRATFLHGQFHPYVFAGPNIGIRVSANVEEQMPPSSEMERRQPGTRDISDHVKALDLAFDAGGGLQYDLREGVSLLVSARYSLGLNSVTNPVDSNDQSFQADSWKSRQFLVLVGVLITI